MIIRSNFECKRSCTENFYLFGSKKRVKNDFLERYYILSCIFANIYLHSTIWNIYFRTSAHAFLCARVYIYVRALNAYICTCVFVCLYVCGFVCLCTCLCACTFMCSRSGVHVCVSMTAWVQCVSVHVCVRVWTYFWVCEHASRQVYLSMSVCMCSCMCLFMGTVRSHACLCGRPCMFSHVFCVCVCMGMYKLLPMPMRICKYFRCRCVAASAPTCIRVHVNVCAYAHIYGCVHLR